MPEPSTLDDAELLAQRTAQGDAFAQFYRRHVDSLLLWCAQRGLAAADAADVTAETFVVALHRREEFDAGEASEGSAQAWLHQIAFSIVARRHRSTERERAALHRWTESRGPLTERDTADYATLREQARETMEWVTGLVPAQQDALVGRELHGRSYADLAAESGTSEATIRRRVSRAIGSLRLRRSQGGDA